MYNKQQDLGLELLFDFVKPEKFSTKRLNYTLSGLVDFCNKYRYVVILSKACKKLKLNFVKVGAMFVKKRTRCRMYAFKDKEYLDCVGKYCEILVTWQDLLNILPLFGVGSDKAKQLLKKSSSCFFDINNYTKFIDERAIIEKKNEIANDAYLQSISIDPSMYYNKEYVSEHKFGSNFLEQYVNKNTLNATDAEKAMQDILTNKGIKYEFQKPCLVFGACYIMDFYLPDYGICIEVDGDYHNTFEQLVKDKERTNNLAITGILVVRFTNEEVAQETKVETFINTVLNPKL